MSKSTYSQRKSQGLCTRCGATAIAGKILCERCAEIRVVAYQAKRSQKTCVECHTSLATEKARCADCAKKVINRVKQAREKYQEAGLCGFCPTPREEGSIYCRRHREINQGYQQKRRKRRLDNRLCQWCESPLPEEWPLLSCEQCRENQRARAETKCRTVFSWYGSKCACCGENRYYFLTLDHVNNDGAEERKQKGQRRHILTRLWKDQKPSPRYQLLCYNCNCAKGAHGTCPHTWADPNSRPECVPDATKGRRRVVN